MRRKVRYDPAQDYYEVLGVTPGASAEEIRQAYRQRARAVHPDLHPNRRAWATEQFQRVNEAYDVLRHSGLRRDYDRLRWPHAPHSPRPAPEQSADAAPAAPERNRSWWEEATMQSARQAAHMRPAPAAPDHSWLRHIGLGAFESTWITLVGLWRTPYAGLLSMLSALLAANLALIIYMAIDPQGITAFTDQLEGWLAVEGKAETSAASPASPTPPRLFRACTHPGVQILNLVSFDRVGERFAVYGTVKHAEMWTYVIELGYLGRTYDPTAAPFEWETLRPHSPNRNAPEAPIENDLLEDNISLHDHARGYYVLRLKVLLRDGSALEPCDVVVRY